MARTAAQREARRLARAHLQPQAAPPAAVPEPSERAKEGAPTAARARERVRALKRVARAGARFALYGVWALVLLGTFGLYSSALDATHYDKNSSAATKRASELTATCAAAGCAEPSVSSPPGLSAAYARQVSSSSPWLAGVFASPFRVFTPAGDALAVLQHATPWASELSATCATAAGCAEPFVSSPLGLSAAYARQVSSSPWPAGGFTSWFYAPAPHGLHWALMAVCTVAAEHLVLAEVCTLFLSFVIILARLRGLDPAPTVPTELLQPQPQLQSQPRPVAAITKRYNTARGARGSGSARTTATAVAAAEERRTATLEMLASAIRDMDAACTRAQASTTNRKRRKTWPRSAWRRTEVCGARFMKSSWTMQVRRQTMITTTVMMAILTRLALTWIGMMVVSAEHLPRV
jgi:hypothetical protein